MNSTEREDSKPEQETSEQEPLPGHEKEFDGCEQESVKLLLMGIIIAAILFKLFC